MEVPTATLRSQNGHSQNGAPELPAVRIDRGARRVWLGDTELDLAAREFDLLVFLADNAGKTLTRSNIMRAVWRQSCGVDSRTVSTHIYRLRAHLGEEGRVNRYITTLYGIGFRWDGPLTDVPPATDVVLKQLADDIRVLGDPYPEDMFPAGSVGGAIRVTAELAATLADEALRDGGGRP